jgi:hypothetical protein
VKRVEKVTKRRIEREREREREFGGLEDEQSQQNEDKKVATKLNQIKSNERDGGMSKRSINQERQMNATGSVWMFSCASCR